MTALIRAELLKLRRQRGATFWGFLAMPLLLILLAIALDASVRPDAAGLIEIHPVRAVLRALAAAGNPVVQLFFAVGAGALFALEYRHATWRLLVPRRSRHRLLIAKLIAFVLAAAASLVLLGAGNLISLYAMPLLRGGQPFTMEAIGEGTAAIALAFAVSMLELATLAALVAMMAVITRSTMGAILPPFLLMLASASAQVYFGSGPGSLLGLPGAAADRLRAGIAISFDSGEALTTDQAIVALAIALAWFVIPMAAAMLLFSRQDLASE